MFGGLNRLLVPAVVAGALLVMPQVASAGCNNGVSAVNVYKECPQSGGGGKATGGGGHTSGATSTPAQISHKTTTKLKSAGKNGKAVAEFVNRYPSVRFLQSHSSGTANEPTAIGSAFDLGSGPTVLLIALAASAALLLGGTGMRVRRNRHRP